MAEQFADESNTGTDIETQDNTGILPAKYQVKKGDTLYNISNMFYNTPIIIRL